VPEQFLIRVAELQVHHRHHRMGWTLLGPDVVVPKTQLCDGPHLFSLTPVPISNWVWDFLCVLRCVETSLVLKTVTSVIFFFSLGPFLGVCSNLLAVKVALSVLSLQHR